MILKEICVDDNCVINPLKKKKKLCDKYDLATKSCKFQHQKDTIKFETDGQEYVDLRDLSALLHKPPWT